MARNSSELSVMKEEIVEVIFFAKRKHTFLILLDIESTFSVDSMAVLHDYFNLFVLSPLIWKVQSVCFPPWTRMEILY